MSLKFPLFLGATSAPRADWQNYIAVAGPASNIKDEVKKRENALERQAKQLDRLANIPIGAALTGAQLLDAAGTIIFSSVDNPAVALWQFLNDHITVLDFENIPLIYGFNARDKLQVAAFTCLRLRAIDNRTDVPQPARTLWHKRVVGHWHPVMDPYEELVKSEWEDDLTLAAVCKFLGLDGPMPDQSHGDDANLAYQLATAGGLL